MSKEKLLICLVTVWLGVFMLAPASAKVDISEFVPPEDDYDWIQLTSNEWLKGELIGFLDDEIKFDSDVLGELEIDWDDIKNIYSSRRYGISIRGHEELLGEISLDRQQLVILTAGREIRVPREELLAVTASAAREIDRWSGDLNLGVNVRQGNTEFVEYNTIAGAQRRTPRSRTLLDYVGNFNETTGEEVANNHRVNGTFDRFSGSRLFWRPLIGQYFRDRFQNIEHQGTLETGLGYDLIDTSKTDLLVYGGAGANFVRRRSVEFGQPKESTSPALSLGTAFETELTSWMDYILSFQMTFLDEESGTYQHHLLTTLSTDLIGGIDLDISFIWDRTENPPPGEEGITPERDDFRLAVGVGFDF